MEMLEYFVNSTRCNPEFFNNFDSDPIDGQDENFSESPDKCEVFATPLILNADEDGANPVPALLWKGCKSKSRNYLMIGKNKPFSVRNATYHVKNIKWRAGRSWPFYTTPCPSKNQPNGYRFSCPPHFQHQIVPLIGNFSFSRLRASSVIRGPETGHMNIMVNDGRSAPGYSDNFGEWDVLVTAWS